MDASFSAPTSIINDLSKDQTTENVVHREPLPHESSLNNTSIAGKVQYQSSSGSRNNAESTRSFIDAQLTWTLSIDEIETYEVWSAFNMLCCNLCFGCIACCFSRETEKLKKQGNIQGALKASKQARNLNIISTIFSIVGIIIFVISFPHVRTF